MPLLRTSVTSVKRIKVQVLDLRQEFHADQDDNNDSQQINKTAGVLESGDERLTEETEQPISSHDQDRQLKQWHLPLGEPGVTRSDFPSDKAGRSIQ